jgi:hypothetical protein
MSEDQPIEITRRQITAKSFLLATAMLGAGAGCVLIVISAAMRPYSSGQPFERLFTVCQALAVGPLIGGGTGIVLRRARPGAYIGFFAEIFALLGLAVIWFGWQETWRDLGWVIVFSVAAFCLGGYSIVRKLWRRRTVKSHSP